MVEVGGCLQEGDRLGGIEGTFFSTGASGNGDTVSSQETIARILDENSAAYGWPVEYVVSLTLYQLKHIGCQRAERIYRDRRVFADSVRAAQGAERYQYERYLDSLAPSVEEDATNLSSSVVIPEGFVHLRMQ